MLYARILDSSHILIVFSCISSRLPGLFDESRLIHESRSGISGHSRRQVTRYPQPNQNFLAIHISITVRWNTEMMQLQATHSLANASSKCLREKDASGCGRPTSIHTKLRQVSLHLHHLAGHRCTPHFTRCHACAYALHTLPFPP
jgi:hypothetical protein